MSTPTRTRASPAQTASSAAHTPARTPLEKPGNGYFVDIQDTKDHDVHTKTARHGANMPHDTRVEPARGAVRRPKLSSWEKQLADNPEVRRKATIAQLCTQIPSHPVLQPSN